MPAIWKIVLATVVLGAFGFVVDSMTNGGHWIIWAVAGAVYGVVCYPWFEALKIEVAKGLDGGKLGHEEDT